MKEQELSEPYIPENAEKFLTKNPRRPFRITPTRDRPEDKDWIKTWDEYVPYWRTSPPWSKGETNPM